MKTINIAAKRANNYSKEICLGNGVRRLFGSLREAGYFIAETNRFLTECLVIVNETYVSTFIQYRQLWFIALNNKTGKNTNYLDVQQRISVHLHTVESLLDKFNNSKYGSNDAFFAFIDLRKSCLFLIEALTEMENFYQKKFYTVQMYQCRILKNRCNLLIKNLNDFGQVEE